MLEPKTQKSLLKENEELRLRAEQAETLLYRNTEQISLIFDSIADIIFQLRVESANTYRFLSVNRSFLKATGMQEHQIRGMTVDQVIPPESLDLVLGQYRTAIEERRTVKWEEKTVYPSGEKTGIVTIVPVFDENNICTHLVGSVHDISERKQAEMDLQIAKEKAELSDHLKSTFLANMSHEIRTPLNAILGYTELLLAENLSADHKEWMRTIKNCGVMLLNLMGDILDLSRIEAGELKIQKETASLRAILTEVDAAAKILNKNETRDIQLTQNVAENSPANFICDSDRIKQVLLNLISNAIKFTPSGSVEYGVSRKDTDTIEFHVRDTGVGIPRDQWDNIFKPFRQAGNSVGSQQGGTGLGLAIAKKLVEKMGGQIQLKSCTGENHGSTFYFSIPYEPGAEQIPESNEPPPKIQPGIGKILIADDNGINRALAERILWKYGYETLTVVNGLEALEKYRSDPSIGLILMDIVMPEMGGLEATQKIREMEARTDNENSIPIFALSAAAMEEDRKVGFKAGCNEYLTKPLQQDELLKLLTKYLGD